MDKAVSALQDGEFAKKAIELDKNKKIEEAVKYYDLAVYFLKITCNEKDQSDPSLDALRKKIIEYKNRSKTLKQQTDQSTKNKDKEEKEKQQQSLQLTIGQELQRGLDLAERAKQHDKNKEFAPAFELYKEALEYFMSVARREDCEQVKMMLNKSIKMYIEHAEKIKKFLVAMNQYTPYQSRKAEDNQTTSLSASRAATKQFGVNDIDMRIGTLRREQSATFWNDAQALQMIAQLSRNIARPGEDLSMNIQINNPASVKVSRVLIHLQQNETTTSLDLKGHRLSKTNTTIPAQWIYIGNKKGEFPVCRASHQGVATVDLPTTLALTEVDHSTCFAREYFVVLIC
eukprot:TRINITY_DN7844_c0_g1_i1.p1 TRINITY_DN7844_c0_g1~~TRINITY_DN7844_c0_g1_i1.p1  ORF type:complete len:344 (+),score=98.60 TRINITY_DN7844_c0_g1_i1:46-1077(+)